MVEKTAGRLVRPACFLEYSLVMECDAGEAGYCWSIICVEIL